MGDREGIIFFRSWRDAIREIPKEQRADAYEAIIDYALDGIVPGARLAAASGSGREQVPLALVIGTKQKGRINAFARNFMPLLEVNSEFAMKWELTILPENSILSSEQHCFFSHRLQHPETLFRIYRSMIVHWGSFPLKDCSGIKKAKESAGAGGTFPVLAFSDSGREAEWKEQQERWSNAGRGT